MIMYNQCLIWFTSKQENWLAYFRWEKYLTFDQATSISSNYFSLSKFFILNSEARYPCNFSISSTSSPIITISSKQMMNKVILPPFRLINKVWSKLRRSRIWWTKFGSLLRSSLSAMKAWIKYGGWWLGQVTRKSHGFSRKKSNRRKKLEVFGNFCVRDNWKILEKMNKRKGIYIEFSLKSNSCWIWNDTLQDSQTPLVETSRASCTRDVTTHLNGMTFQVAHLNLELLHYPMLVTERDWNVYENFEWHVIPISSESHGPW